MPRNAMMGPNVVLVFCYGLFSVGAQSLLFREYMAAFERLDLAIGLFFVAWLISVASGAFLFRKIDQAPSPAAKTAELLVAAYVPALGLSYGLVMAIQYLAGPVAAAHRPFWYIIGSSLLVTAPLGLLTGALFPILNRRIGERENTPLGRVYMLEAAGSVVGGVVVAALLHRGG